MSQNLRNHAVDPAPASDEQQGQRSDDTNPMALLPPMTLALDQRYAPYPLTDLQQAYWIGQTDLIELGNMYPHGYMEFDFTQLDLARLHQVIQRLIERHDALRGIVRSDGQQQVLPATPPYRIAMADLRGQDEQAVTSHLLATREHMSHHGPSTHDWPQWEIRASLLDEQRTRLHISFCLILVDARSMPILIKEGVQLYQRPDAALPPLALTFRDYVMAVSALDQTDLYRQSQAYWRRRLATLPPAPELPLSRRPSDIREARFVSHSARLDASTWQRLKERAARQGVTPDAVVTTAFAEVIAAWSKIAHFTLNLVVSDRFPLHPQVTDLVGNFNATSLLEVNHTAPATFIVRATRLQQQLADDRAHRYVNGVRVIREVATAQGWTAQAVMPVIFVCSIRKDPAQGGGLFAESREQGKPIYQCLQTPQVSLDVQVFDDEDGLLIMWIMLDELFPDGVPTAMRDAYCRLLRTLAADEAAWQQPPHPLASAQQLSRYDAVNATGAPVSADLLQTLVTTQAARRPDREAVITTTRRLTYADIHRMGTQAGHWLRQAGARPNTLVAVVMEKGWEQVVATLGVLYAGAAYLPIDPALPRERLWYLLDHGNVHYALTQPWIDDRLEWPDGVKHLCVDDDHLAALPTQDLAPVQQPEDLAYVIYTSGSTGLPKGVMIDHRGAVNTLLDLNTRCAVGPADRVLALSSLSFDLSVYDIFGTLGAGGALVMPDADAAQDPAHWARLLRQEKITIWNSVPALMEMLAERLANRDERLPRSLRLVLLSGDWIPVQLPTKIAALGDGVCVISLGGATEASIWSILYPIGTVDPAWTSIPYGRPMVNQRVYVLDADLNQRPAWVPGQLYIGGRGLARGYWRDEAKTASSFITHPRTGERLYRTGDLGRYRPDGTIEFLGRDDAQVKVQGYRVELGEIEATLARHPAVREAVATVENTEQGGKRLVAYVVPRKERDLDTGELRAFMGAKLPAYMVPAAIGVIDTVPLTANGKVDRKALPRWAETAPIHGHDFVAPRDALERRLADLWETILERHPVGVTDNFFELGGNSLAALRLMGWIRQRFSHDLPLALLFERATVAELADVLRQPAATSPHRRSPLVPIHPSGTGPALFLVHPVGGNVLCYAELSRRLGADQPVYALQAPGVDGDGEPYTDLTEMAAFYRDAIRTVQPAGPYLIGGWSMGGTVALEMARQLRDEGEGVPLVALLDSDVPSSVEGAPPLDDADHLAWFAQDLGGSAGQRLLISGDDLRRLEPDARLSYVLAQARAVHVLPPDAALPHLRRLARVFTAHTHALSNYTPRPYTGRSVLFPADETRADHAGDQTLGWGTLLGATLEVYPVSGNHYTMLAHPHVRQLAERLKGCLDATRTVTR